MATVESSSGSEVQNVPPFSAEHKTLTLHFCLQQQVRFDVNRVLEKWALELGDAAGRRAPPLLAGSDWGGVFWGAGAPLQRSGEVQGQRWEALQF